MLDLYVADLESQAAREQVQLINAVALGSGRVKNAQEAIRSLERSANKNMPKASTRTRSLTEATAVLAGMGIEVENA